MNFINNVKQFSNISLEGIYRLGKRCESRSLLSYIRTDLLFSHVVSNS